MLCSAPPLLTACCASPPRLQRCRVCRVDPHCSPHAEPLPSPPPAQRCRVHSTLFMPLYDSPRRSACVGVFEVVMTDPEPNFAGMVGWIM